MSDAEMEVLLAGSTVESIPDIVDSSHENMDFVNTDAENSTNSQNKESSVDNEELGIPCDPNLWNAKQVGVSWLVYTNTTVPTQHKTKNKQIC